MAAPGATERLIHTSQNMLQPWVVIDKPPVMESALTVTAASLPFDCSMTAAPIATSAASTAGSITLVAIFFHNFTSSTVRHPYHLPVRHFGSL